MCRWYIWSLKGKTDTDDGYGCIVTIVWDNSLWHMCYAICLLFVRLLTFDRLLLFSSILVRRSVGFWQWHFRQRCFRKNVSGNVCFPQRCIWQWIFPATTVSAIKKKSLKKIIFINKNYKHIYQDMAILLRTNSKFFFPFYTLFHYQSILITSETIPIFFWNFPTFLPAR